MKRGASPSWLFKAIAAAALFLYFVEDAKLQSSLLASVSSRNADEPCVNANSNTNLNGNIPKKVDSGWDAAGRQMYHDRVLSLSTSGVINTTVYPPMMPWPTHLAGGYFVSNDNCGNRNFWGNLANGGWERQTFHIFNKYIVPGNTTAVDFGTWIGPTLLYHGGYSRRSFGMEADPVAFAVAEYNVGLNRKLNPGWGTRVSVDSGCISRPEDVGSMTMKAGGHPGKSMSGINAKVYQDKGANSVKWNVSCNSLPDIFENYWGIHRPYEDVFIKIDVESYECKLVPSFYDWLKEEQYLPKMYISFHPQIDSCNDEEFEGVLRFLRLYDHVRVRGDTKEWKVNDATMVEELKETLGGDVVVYQNHHRLMASSNEVS